MPPTYLALIAALATAAPLFAVEHEFRPSAPGGWAIWTVPSGPIGANTPLPSDPWRTDSDAVDSRLDVPPGIYILEAAAPVTVLRRNEPVSQEVPPGEYTLHVGSARSELLGRVQEAYFEIELYAQMNGQSFLPDGGYYVNTPDPSIDPDSFFSEPEGMTSPPLLPGVPYVVAWEIACSLDCADVRKIVSRQEKSISIYAGASVVFYSDGERIDGDSGSVECFDGYGGFDCQAFASDSGNLLMVLPGLSGVNASAIGEVWMLF